MLVYIDFDLSLRGTNIEITDHDHEGPVLRSTANPASKSWVPNAPIEAKVADVKATVVS